MKHNPGKSLLSIGLTAAMALVWQSNLWATGIDLTGMYKVPEGVYMDTPVDLPVRDIDWNLRIDGIYSLEYDLPYELTGENARSIELHSISAEKPLQLSGEQGQAVCVEAQAELSCTVTYKKNQDGIFPLDTQAGLAFMQANNFDPLQIQTVVRAQETLMHEAVGILTFKLPGA